MGRKLARWRGVGKGGWGAVLLCHPPAGQKGRIRHAQDAGVGGSEAHAAADRLGCGIARLDPGEDLREAVAGPILT